MSEHKAAADRLAETLAGKTDADVSAFVEYLHPVYRTADHELYGALEGEARQRLRDCDEDDLASAASALAFNKTSA